MGALRPALARKCDVGGMLAITITSSRVTEAYLPTASEDFMLPCCSSRTDFAHAWKGTEQTTPFI